MRHRQKEPKMQSTLFEDTDAPASPPILGPLGPYARPMVNTRDVGTIDMSRPTDDDTSAAAAIDAVAHASGLRARCLEALRHAGPDGLTDFELGAIVRAQQTSAGKRRLELQRMGLVERTSLTRPAPSGSAARVWRATS